jgi:hypothetical protein
MKPKDWKPLFLGEVKDSSPVFGVSEEKFRDCSGTN